MDWYVGGAALGLLTAGLVGQGFEMRRIRKAARSDGELASASIFTDRRNLKWYAVIGAGVALWYVAERGGF